MTLTINYQPTKEDIEYIQTLGFTSIEYYKQTKSGKVKLTRYSWAADLKTDLPVFHDTVLSASLHLAYIAQEKQWYN